MHARGGGSSRYHCAFICAVQSAGFKTARSSSRDWRNRQLLLRQRYEITVITDTAVDSLGRGGLVHAMLVATAVRACQAVAFYVTAAYAPPVSEEAQWVAEGVALGSLAIMTVEFLGPAARGLGREWVAGTILASLLASYWLDSIFHSIV
ncbi:hypothetical protein ERJ75_000056600 [Trypanosoma vivax]|nr:hypothetical protein ERJ75_000056600 [Trypanosoma vivax]